MKVNFFLRIIINFFRLPILHINNIILDKKNLISIFSTITTIKGSIIIGKWVQIEPNTLVKSSAGSITIEDEVFINRNCMIVSHKKISIGEKTTIGPNTCIYDHDHNFKNKESKYITDDVIIGKNVWIGSNCILLKGINIGDNSVIGAGTIVSEDIEPNTVVYQDRVLKKYKRKDKDNEGKNRYTTA